MKRFGLALMLIAGCTGGSTGLDLVSYPLIGTGVAPAPFAVQGWQVTVTQAHLGFGPLYLCAAVAVSPELCETAVAEWATSGTFDGANASPQPLGEVHGFSGIVHSALYDYAYSWLGDADARPQPGAPGGHSAHLAVTATKGGRTLRVTADIDVVPGQRASFGGGSRLAEQAQSAALTLEIAVDPAAWWRHVDFDALSMVGGDDLQIPAAGMAAPALLAARNQLVSALASTDRPSFTFHAR
jgi:hypothetical protein